MLAINNLNNKTNFTNLLVSGASTCSSSLNVVGNIIGNGTALTNLNYNSILNPPNIISPNFACTFLSTINISGITTFNNSSTNFWYNMLHQTEPAAYGMRGFARSS